jgi:ferredoxin-NADP reductase
METPGQFLSVGVPRVRNILPTRWRTVLIAGEQNYLTFFSIREEERISRDLRKKCKPLSVIKIQRPTKQ